jgi:hypothetical protein
MKKAYKTTLFLTLGAIFALGFLFTSPTPVGAQAALSVDCSVSETFIMDRDNTPVTYTANYAGGTSGHTFSWSGPFSSSAQTVNHTFTSDGSFVAVVTVTDSDGNTDTDVCPTVSAWDAGGNNNNNNDDLDVTCRVSDTRIEEGDEVRFEADVDGGDSPFEYDWDGDISGDDRVERVEFDRDGNYRVEITVEDDDGNRASDTCPTIRVEEEDDDDDLEVQCRVSDRTVEVGERVRFEADVDGGDSPFEYDWDGDISGDDRREDVRFDEPGTYEVEITVEDDDNNRDSDDCPTIRVTDDDDNDGDLSVSFTSSEVFGGPTTGQLTSFNSVFLGQIPQTGVADVMQVILYTLFLLTLSFVAVYSYKKRQLKKYYSDRIAQFKELNRTQA